MTGADEIYDLARDLNRAAAETPVALRPVVQEGMSDIKDKWRDNARETSGAHGRHYPNSITYDTRILVGEVVGEVGPDSSRPQGSMGRGFEYGSENQPPHLDGLKATSDLGPALARKFDTTIGFLIP